jgi:hypothetical protein
MAMRLRRAIVSGGGATSVATVIVNLLESGHFSLARAPAM